MNKLYNLNIFNVFYGKFGNLLHFIHSKFYGNLLTMLSCQWFLRKKSFLFVIFVIIWRQNFNWLYMREEKNRVKILFFEILPREYSYDSNLLGGTLHFPLRCIFISLLCIYSFLLTLAWEMFILGCYCYCFHCGSGGPGLE